MADKINQENQPDIGIDYEKSEPVFDSPLHPDDLTDLNTLQEAEVIIPQPSPQKPEPEQPKKPTYITDFPYCPVRVGRLTNNITEGGGRNASAVPTCGYREVKLEDCLECNFQHALKENKILNGKKVVKHSEDIRELKQRLDTTEDDVEELKKMIGYLIHGVIIEGKKT